MGFLFCFLQKVDCTCWYCSDAARAAAALNGTLHGKHRIVVDISSETSLVRATLEQQAYKYPMYRIENLPPKYKALDVMKLRSEVSHLAVLLST